MILAISSEGKDLESAVDPRFGRAKYFIIYDTDSDDFSAFDNTQNIQAMQGSGIQTAQNVAGQKAEVVIAGNLGPKAFRTLSAAGIKSIQWAEGTVAEAVELFKQGKFEYAEGANVEGHW